MTIHLPGRPTPGSPTVATRRSTPAGPGDRSPQVTDRNRSAGLDDSLHGVLLNRPPRPPGDATARSRTALLPMRQASPGLPKTAQQMADAVCRQFDSGALPLRSNPSRDTLQRVALLASKRLLEFSAH